jgi:hypothetical protein
MGCGCSKKSQQNVVADQAKIAADRRKQLLLQDKDKKKKKIFM